MNKIEHNEEILRKFGIEYCTEGNLEHNSHKPNMRCY